MWEFLLKYRSVFSDLNHITNTTTPVCFSVGLAEFEGQMLQSKESLTNALVPVLEYGDDKKGKRKISPSLEFTF